jgi:hypothetical protein
VAIIVGGGVSSRVWSESIPGSLEIVIPGVRLASGTQLTRPKITRTTKIQKNLRKEGFPISFIIWYFCKISKLT